jgi:hypothetical protein
VGKTAGPDHAFTPRPQVVSLPWPKLRSCRVSVVILSRHLGSGAGVIPKAQELRARLPRPRDPSPRVGRRGKNSPFTQKCSSGEGPPNRCHAWGHQLRGDQPPSTGCPRPLAPLCRGEGAGKARATVAGGNRCRRRAGNAEPGAQSGTHRKHSQVGRSPAPCPARSLPKSPTPVFSTGTGSGFGPHPGSGRCPGTGNHPPGYSHLPRNLQPRRCLVTSAAFGRA